MRNREKYEIEPPAAHTSDGRARCPRCAVVLNDERRPADFTDHMSGIDLCPDCQSNEAEKAASSKGGSTDEGP